MHVLITGGAGFIGSHIVEFHLNRGDHVLVVDDLSTGTRENVDMFIDNPNYRFEKADILTWKNIESSICWADRIYHMAAVVGLFKVLEEPIKVLATNIAGAERLLRAVQSCKWDPDIVMASTSEVYGNRFSGVSEDSGAGHDCVANNMPCQNFERTERGIELSEDMALVVNSNLNARTNYSVSKLADELFGLSYARQFGLKVRMIRFFNVVGPRQRGKYGMVVPRFVSQGVNGEDITVFGEGTQTRCFMDVRDAVTALDLLSSTPDSVGEVINVGVDNEITVTELAELVKRVTGKQSKITYTPYQEAYGEGYDEIYHRRPSLKKLHRLIAFRPKWTLEKTIEDLTKRERGEIDSLIREKQDIFPVR